MNTFTKIIEKHFHLVPEKQLPELTAHDIPEWDSMNFLLLIADLEKEFNVSFTMDEILYIKSLGHIQKIIENKNVIL